MTEEDNSRLQASFNHVVETNAKHDERLPLYLTDFDECVGLFQKHQISTDNGYIGHLIESETGEPIII